MIFVPTDEPAVTAGALRYIQKNTLSEKAVKDIETVHGGQGIFQQGDLLLKKKRVNPSVLLTAREQEQLRHIMDGCTSQQITGRMFLRVETIKTCRRNLVFKPGTKNAAEMPLSVNRSRAISFLHQTSFS